MRERLLVSTLAVLGAAVTVVAQDGTTTDDDASNSSVWFTVLNFGLCVVLIAFSGLFSGLTLGLMGLDLIGLEIVMKADPTSKDARNARRIHPIRKRGNQLLCTLLLGNTAVNALLSITLSQIAGGLVGFLVSTGFIVVLGEISPQAACSRYALTVGAKSVGLMKIIMFLLWPLAKPISILLDWVLGGEVGTIHSKKQLMQLLKIHMEHKALDADELGVMTGAMAFKQKEVRDVMTKVEDVYMLQIDQRLNFATMADLFRRGHSRVPVYQRDTNDVVGVLYTKDLILIDPEDATPVRNVLQFFPRSYERVYPDAKLGDVLRLFRQGKGHLAIVHDVNNEGDGDPWYEVKGIVTLEDIIEEILQAKITDEYDMMADNRHKHSDRPAFDYARLRLLDSARRSDLEEDEVRAISAHLLTNVPQFRPEKLQGLELIVEDVEELVRGCAVLELRKPRRRQPSRKALSAAPSASGMAAAGAASVAFATPPSVERSSTLDAKLSEEDGVGGSAEDRELGLLYRRGRVDMYCTLILSGKMLVLAGRDEFRTEVGSWSVLCAEALLSPGGYVPDFTATANSDCVRCIRVACSDFQHMLARVRTRAAGETVSPAARSPALPPLRRSSRSGSNAAGLSLSTAHAAGAVEEKDGSGAAAQLSPPQGSGSAVASPAFLSLEIEGDGAADSK